MPFLPPNQQCQSTGISIGSSVFAQLTVVTNRSTHKQTMEHQDRCNNKPYQYSIVLSAINHHPLSVCTNYSLLATIIRFKQGSLLLPVVLFHKKESHQRCIHSIILWILCVAITNILFATAPNDNIDHWLSRRIIGSSLKWLSLDSGSR